MKSKNSTQQKQKLNQRVSVLPRSYVADKIQFYAEQKLNQGVSVMPGSHLRELAQSLDSEPKKLNQRVSVMPKEHILALLQSSTDKQAKAPSLNPETEETKRKLLK